MHADGHTGLAQSGDDLAVRVDAGLQQLPRIDAFGLEDGRAERIMDVK
ncbi:hypothetical protein [Actinopolymorpha pittospori]